MMASCLDNSTAHHSGNHAPPSSFNFTHIPSYSLKHVGLDPLHRIFFKLFIRDVIFLKEAEFEEVDSMIFSFNGHVVLKVEIVGILVRVDLKDTRHAYVVDDGTGTITCNVWKSGKKGSPQRLTGLPKTLMKKHEEVISSYTPQKEGFYLSDLVCIRGQVGFFAGHKEIDVLDMFKYDNPNCELNRVLELSHLYSEFYAKPFFPSSLRATISSTSELIRNPDVLKFEMVKCIEKNEAAINIFTIKDTLTWMSLKSLQNSSVNSTGQALLTVVKSALESISETHGLICKRCDKASDYEVVKEGCGLCHELLKILHFHHRNSAETGSHIKQISLALKKSPQYADATHMAVQKALQILENTSELIRVDANRYMPLI